MDMPEFETAGRHQTEILERRGETAADVIFGKDDATLSVANGIQYICRFFPA
jgi:hypothetical protein